MGIENVLLVTIDSLRYDFQSTDAKAISKLSERGISFQSAFATGPGTTPSFPGILTSSHPLSYDGLGKISDERPFLARELRSRGLATAGFHSNPFLAESFNYDTGFDTFEDYQDSLTDAATRLFPQGIEKSLIPDPITGALKKTYELLQGKPRPYERAETITDDAVKWLTDAPSGFFGWVHYMDVHHPCFPPDPYLQEFDLAGVSDGDISTLYSRALESPESISAEDRDVLVDSYRASIRYVDDQIDRLLETLRKQGQLDETLVIITSDHGQLFGGFDAYGKPYRLVDALVKVPLIVLNAPDNLEESTEELVSLVDLPPMIHDALGFDCPDAYEGYRPNGDESRELIFTEHQVDDSVIVGARSDQEKYVVDDITDEDRAYRINSTGESMDEISSVSKSLRNRVTKRLEETDVDLPEYVSQVDRATEQRLEDLGYL